jgi:L-ascorbate metabolism protein UlaG (beta-lactamase superfamily)
MDCVLTLTANAGVIVEIGKTRILIDALHNEKIPGFSAVTPEILSAIGEKFRICEPTAVIATHAHPDHASADLWNKARCRWPNTRFISPGFPLIGTDELSVERQQLQLESGTIDAVRLPHEADAKMETKHYGYLLELDGCGILVPGDCSIDAASQLHAFVGGRQVDIALLNFSWITLPKARAIIEEQFYFGHLVLYHLPFLEDDVDGFRDAAFKAVESMSAQNSRILSEPFQTIVIGK